MRPFNNREKRILEKVSKMEPGDPRTFPLFMQEEIFTDSGKIAPIIYNSDHQQGIMVGVRSEDQKDIIHAVDTFIEAVLLIDYLSKNDYIVSASEKPLEPPALMPLYSEFNDVSISQENPEVILLNQQGHHFLANKPDYIFDKVNKPIFKLILLPSQGFSLYKIFTRNLLGRMYIRQELKELVKKCP
jgi:hypothetical protein